LAHTYMFWMMGLISHFIRCLEQLED